jgi:hypothetical protein
LVQIEEPATCAGLCVLLGVCRGKLAAAGGVAEQAAGWKFGDEIEEQPLLRPDERRHRLFMSM